MLAVYRWFTAVLFASVVVQVALIGYAMFYLGHKLENEGSVTKTGVEGPFTIHAVFGTIMIGAMLILFLATVAGRLGRSKVKWTGALFVLGFLQIVFAEVGFAVPALGFLHPVNALLIFAVTGAMAHRAWAEARSPVPDAGRAARSL